MGTAERRREIIKILCKRRHETIKNLASEFGVSVRTIQRDIESLSITEPIYTQSGKYTGGVYVVDVYFVERMYMTIPKYMYYRSCIYGLTKIYPYSHLRKKYSGMYYLTILKACGKVKNRKEIITLWKKKKNSFLKNYANSKN